MAPDGRETPFDSIESAQDYMSVLAETILETLKELNDDCQQASREGLERRARALELALFKLKTLSCYVHKSRRILNDLRMIRRLVLNERAAADGLSQEDMIALAGN